MRVTTEVKLRGYHTDSFGHVNHARYLELLEEGRWQYMEHHPLLVDYCHRRGLTHAVVNVNIDYRRPALLGHVLQIETEVLDATDHSVVMLQTVTRKGTDILVVDAEVTNVFIDGQSNQVGPLVGELVGLWPDLGEMTPTRVRKEVTNVFIDGQSNQVGPLVGELVGLWPDLGK